jgi:imidazolonepropionase-like amidohydrolase
MKTRFFLSICVLFLSVVATAQVTVIRAGTLIDGRSNTAKHNQVIVIRDNKIESVADAASFTAPAGANVIDLSNATVLPGMIDAHTHIFLQGEDPAEGGYDVQLLNYPISYRSVRAAVAARRALEQGFTTIRDLETEGAGYGDMGIKHAVNEGIIPGPRIFGVTRAISTTAGYPLEGYNPEIVVPKGAQLIDGPVEARKAAREQLDHGADWIKVYMTHRSWIDKKTGNLQSQPTLTVEELRAIVDETHGWGKKVACHAYNGIGMQRALDGGCDSIEHGLELTDANIAQMLKQGTWYCPTMAVYYSHWEPENTDGGKRDRKRAEVHMGSLTKAYKAGVKIAFGTDVGDDAQYWPNGQTGGRQAPSVVLADGRSHAYGYRRQQESHRGLQRERRTYVSLIRHLADDGGELRRIGDHRNAPDQGYRRQRIEILKEERRQQAAASTHRHGNNGD